MQRCNLQIYTMTPNSFEDAIGWYEAALAIDESNIDASTDLGLSYYYTSRADRALLQFDYSLSIDPNHVATLLNQGIVRAFGRQDFDGAIVSLETSCRSCTHESGGASCSTGYSEPRSDAF